MGYIELHDGVSTRRIEAPELPGVVRIELRSDDPRVVVPDGVTVDRPDGEPGDPPAPTASGGFDFAGDR